MGNGITITLMVLTGLAVLVGGAILADYIYFHPRRMSDDKIKEDLLVLDRYHNELSNRILYVDTVRQIEKRTKALRLEQERRKNTTK